MLITSPLPLDELSHPSASTSPSFDGPTAFRGA